MTAAGVRRRHAGGRRGRRRARARRPPGAGHGRLRQRCRPGLRRPAWPGRARRLRAHRAVGPRFVGRAGARRARPRAGHQHPPRRRRLLPGTHRPTRRCRRGSPSSSRARARPGARSVWRSPRRRSPPSLRRAVGLPVRDGLLVRASSTTARAARAGVQVATSWCAPVVAPSSTSTRCTTRSVWAGETLAVDLVGRRRRAHRHRRSSTTPPPRRPPDPGRRQRPGRARRRRLRRPRPGRRRRRGRSTPSFMTCRTGPSR